MKTLGLEAAQLVGAQPKSGRIVREKEKEIVDAWNTLKSRVSWYNKLQCSSYTVKPQYNDHFGT